MGMTLLAIPWFKLEGIVIPGTQIGIQPFGILVALGIWFGLKHAIRHGARNGIPAELISDCATHVVVIGFVLGHIFDLVAYHPHTVFEEPWRLLFVWENLSSYGGVFGSGLGGLYWSYKRKVPLLPVYDCIGYGFPLGWVFGRLGCFVVHDHPGKETDFFLAVADYQYPGLPVATRHDLGLYEVFWALAIVLLFARLARKPRPAGLYTGLVALLYAPFRFALDFLRADDAVYAGLTPGHYASLCALGIGTLLLLNTQRQAPHAQPGIST